MFNVISLSPHLQKLIMPYVTTSSLSLLINDTPTPLFSPSRGIKQGDPISPYLFLLCMEYLTWKINNRLETRLWKPF